MIANYGYKDGSGEYFISINTHLCVHCANHACVDACPMRVFAIIVDDYDDRVASVYASARNSLKYTCANCKPVRPTAPPPCIQACAAGAITHSW